MVAFQARHWASAAHLAVAHISPRHRRYLTICPLQRLAICSVLLQTNLLHPLASQTSGRTPTARGRCTTQNPILCCFIRTRPHLTSLGWLQTIQTTSEMSWRTLISSLVKSGCFNLEHMMDT